MTYSAAGRLALAQRIDSMSRPAFAPPPARTIPMTLDSGPRSSWPVELQAPPIERHRAGNTGVPFFWSFEAAAAGPHGMVKELVPEIGGGACRGGGVHEQARRGVAVE